MTHPLTVGQWPSMVTNENWDEGLCSSDYTVSHATLLLYSYPDISLISTRSIITQTISFPNDSSSSITPNQSIGTVITVPAVEMVSHTHYTPPAHVLQRVCSNLRPNLPFTAPQQPCGSVEAGDSAESAQAPVSSSHDLSKSELKVIRDEHVSTFATRAEGGGGISVEAVVGES